MLTRKVKFISKIYLLDHIVDDLLTELILELNNKSSHNLFKQIKLIIKQIEGIKNFTYIGDINLDSDEIENNFDIFCRLNESKNKNDDGRLEFLFNDVSRTKLKEKQKAEFTYKTLFLSKVAHEFKNPLICTTELINEIYSSKAHSKNKEDILLLEKLNQIKSMSDFLLILVRDLNYLSQIEMGKSLPLENELFDLKNVLDFCNEISKSLLKKSNKENMIEFKIKINEDVPTKIYTDEWRLKQVIINLISNSIKFTLNGEIKLEVLRENINDKEFLKFLVKDTGAGMTNEQKNQLFKPFSKGIGKMNQTGSGLGLSIATDIASRLGKKIDFSSEYGKGSSFWFYVTLPNQDEINIKTKNETNNLIKMESINNDSLVENKFSESPNESILTVKENFSYSKEDIKKSFDVSENSISLKKFIMDKGINILNEKERIISDSEVSTFDFKFKINFASEKDLYFLKRKDAINIIVTDDEFLTRQSTVRNIQAIANEYKIKINIIEGEDGIETAYIIYKCLLLEIKISMIFSDESMHFISGSRSSELISEILNPKNILKIPYYLVTGHDADRIISLISKSVDKILEKPLKKEVAKKLIFEAVKDITKKPN